MTGSNFFEAMFVSSPTVPTKESSRTLRAAFEDALMTYTRVNLETVLADIRYVG